MAGEKGYERANGRLLHYLHLLDRLLRAEINVLVGPALLTWLAVPKLPSRLTCAVNKNTKRGPVDPRRRGTKEGERVKEKEKKITMLVSNAGGNLIMWTGAGPSSLTELIERRPGKCPFWGIPFDDRSSCQSTLWQSSL